MRGLRCRGGGGAIGPAALALVFDLDRAIANRALAAPATIGPLHAVRIEEEDGIAERAPAGTPTLARRGIELLVGRGKERPVNRVQDERFPRPVLADDRQHVAGDIQQRVFVSVPVDEPDAAHPGAVGIWALAVGTQFVARRGKRCTNHHQASSLRARSSCCTSPAGGRNRSIKSVNSYTPPKSRSSRRNCSSGRWRSSAPRRRSRRNRSNAANA